MKKIVLLAVLAAILLTTCATGGGAIKEGRKGPFTDKKGVSYGFEQDKTPEQDMALLTSANGIKWFYNWFVVPDPRAGDAAKAHDVLFYPMSWNDMFSDSDRGREKLLEAYLAEHPEIDWIMGYNEPNLTDQCNYTPREAARSWPKLVKFAKKHNLKILSPAMNYGTLENYWVPWVWLDEFFGIDYYDEETGRLVKNKGFPGVSLNDIDAISIHSYMPDAGALKWFISMFLKYKKPIWVTEFCSWEYSQPNAAWQNAEYQQMFMSEAVTMLELHPDVEKYAWFIPKGAEDETVIPGNKLLTKGPNPRLTPLGTVFVNMGSCDKNLWYPTGKRIPAAHFNDMIFSDYIYKTDEAKEPVWPRKEQGFTKNSGVHFRPTTDAGGEALDMFDFSVMKWVEYQVEAPAAKAYTLSLRNTAEDAARIAITVNGQDAGVISLPKASAWRTSTISVQMPAGKNKIRLRVLEGDCTLNWINVE